ncbi:hypothetical protein CPB86DRAFT_701147 [Serendipita vermifera]|nr:hypothetical protein CPB86DRAFT_701147 [Serendipita vermifera]
MFWPYKSSYKWNGIDIRMLLQQQNYTPLLFVILLFPLSTALVIGSLWTLPIRLPSTYDENTAASNRSVFPHTISEVKALAWELRGYSETGPWELGHVLLVLSITALWKHAWSIPGSVLLNILTGTLLSPFWATLLQTTLTTIGSVLSTILATPLTPIITRFFPSAISLTRNALQGTSPSTTSTAPRRSTSTKSPSATSSSPWARLSVLRLIGIVPWSGINIASGVCSVPLLQCAIGAFIGTLPWTAVTCQIGDILQTVASAPISPNAQGQMTVSSVLTSPQTVIKLVVLTLVSLAPILAKERLKTWLNGGEDESSEEGEWVNGEMRERKSRRYHHKKRFSVEWWRRSLSLSRSGRKEEDEGAEELEMLGPDERA